MNELTYFLYDMLVIFGLSIGVLLVCHRYKVHMVVGLLITGILAGPHGLHLIHKAEEVEHLAEIGVILLLFTIGIELSLKHLMRIARAVFVGGGLMVVFTVAIVYAASMLFNLTWQQAIFAGFLVCLSSTAIVLKLFQERGEMPTQHAQVALAILIFQDVAVVPMMLLVPILAGAGDGGFPVGELALLSGKAVLVLIFAYLAARYLVPRLLLLVARMRSREIFLIAILGLCVSITLLTSWIGLSLALGAFLAGLVVSESEYGHQAMGNIQPFKDVFTSFFFVSIGMLLNVQFFITHILLVGILAILVLILKVGVVSAACLVLKLPLKVGIMVGLALCQIGEFSFILARVGQNAGLITNDFYQTFLAVTVVTMSVTPVILGRSKALAQIALKLPLPDKLKFGGSAELAVLDPSHQENHQEHLLIIGFGVIGRHLAKAVQAGGIPYTIIETNPDTVANERANGEPIFFGDAAEAAVLTHAGIDKALVLAITIPDPIGTRSIVGTARELNPQIHIVARTRYVREVEVLKHLQADEVIAEEFETSLQLFARVLHRYLLPRDLVEQFTHQLRSEGPSNHDVPTPHIAPVTDKMPPLTLYTYRVEAGAKADGATLAALHLGTYQLRSILHVRGETQTKDPADDLQLQANDQLLLLGETDDLAAADVLFHTPRKA